MPPPPPDFSYSGEFFSTPFSHAEYIASLAFLVGTLTMEL